MWICRSAAAGLVCTHRTWRRDLIGACASRYPSLSCPLARLVRAAPLLGWISETTCPRGHIPAPPASRPTSRSPVVSTRIRTPTPPQHSTRPAGCWGTGSSRPPRPVTPHCWPGWARLGSWCGSGLKVAEFMGLAWLGFCRRLGWSWSRSTARTVRPAAGRVSPTRSTPRPPRGLPRPVGPAVSRKTRGGKVDALRALRVARRSAVAARADAQRQIKALIVTAPDALRMTLRGLGDRELIAHCATRRPDRAAVRDPTVATMLALRALARRHQQLSVEIDELDALIAPAGHRDQPHPDWTVRGRRRRRRTAAGHRGGQPPAATQRGGVRDALWGRTAARLVRAHPPPPAQPRRRSPGQRRALSHRVLPAALGPPHPRLRAAAHHRRHVQARDHPLPQALHHP